MRVQDSTHLFLKYHLELINSSLLKYLDSFTNKRLFMLNKGFKVHKVRLNLPIPLKVLKLRRLKALDEFVADRPKLGLLYEGIESLEGFLAEELEVKVPLLEHQLHVETHEFRD